MKPDPRFQKDDEDLPRDDFNWLAASTLRDRDTGIRAAWLVLRAHMGCCEKLYRLEFIFSMVLSLPETTESP